MSSSAYGDPVLSATDMQLAQKLNMTPQQFMSMSSMGGGTAPTAPASAPAISSGGAPPQPQGYNTSPVAPQGSQVQFHPPAAQSIVGGSGGGSMGILGGFGGMDPYSVSGGFGSGSSSGTSQGTSSSQQSTQMIPGMMGVYNQLLGINQGHYGNVMNAYQGQLQNNQSQLPGIYGGYGQLGGDVMNTLGMGQVLGQNGNWGVAGPAAQAIGNTYQQQVGTNAQNMTNAGLGNTTVGANANNQAAQAAALSYGQLGSQLADKAAGYQSQIGQAGLAARMQGLGMQTGLTSSALNPLGSQLSNTAGSLTGSFGSSQSQQSSQQQAQNRNQQQSNSGGGGNQSGGGNNLPPGVPGGPGGGYGTGGGGAGGGGTLGGNPYDPVGAYGGGSGGYGGWLPGQGAIGKGPGGSTTIDTGANKSGGSYSDSAGADKPGGSVSGGGGDPYNVGSDKGGNYPGQTPQAPAPSEEVIDAQTAEGNTFGFMDTDRQGNKSAIFYRPDGSRYVLPVS